VKVNFSNAQSLALLHLTRPTNKTIKNRAKLSGDAPTLTMRR
jgi:hypothetical protein